MKKKILLTLTILLIICTQLFFESCKKDPIEKSKSDLFKELRGTWTLIDYTANSSGWMTGFSGHETWVYSNNVVTYTRISTTYEYPNATSDTIIDTFIYIKHLDFYKYKKDLVHYKESTIKSSTSTTTDNSVDWTNFNTDSLTIKIENNNCKLEIDPSDNLLITYDFSTYHIGGGSNSNIKWTFKKE